MRKVETIGSEIHYLNQLYDMKFDYSEILDDEVMDAIHKNYEYDSFLRKENFINAIFAMLISTEFIYAQTALSQNASKIHYEMLLKILITSVIPINILIRYIKNTQGLGKDEMKINDGVINLAFTNAEMQVCLGKYDDLDLETLKTINNNLKKNRGFNILEAAFIFEDNDYLQAIIKTGLIKDIKIPNSYFRELLEDANRMNYFDYKSEFDQDETGEYLNSTLETIYLFNDLAFMKLSRNKKLYADIKKSLNESHELLSAFASLRKISPIEEEFYSKKKIFDFTK